MSIHYKVLIPVLLISSWAFGQGTPINVQRGSRAVIVNDARFKAQLNLGIPVVADTSNALNGGLDSLGLLIQIRSTGVQYKRDTFPGGHKWTIIGSGGIGGYDSTIMQTIYRSDTAKQAIRNSIAGKQATGNYITSLNTDVVTSGFSGGAAVATIQGHAVTNAKSAQMASRTVKANITGSTADPVDVPIDSLASHITPDSVRFYRKPGSDSVFFCVTPISTGVEKCVFQYHDSIGTGGGSSFDSLTSQGGVFHTGNFNDARYRQTLDTLFAHLLMTRAWGYKISDSLAADYISRIASKRDITDTSFAHLLMTRAWGYKISDSIFAVVNAALAGKQPAMSGTGYPKFSGTTTPTYLSPTQVTADLNTFTTTLKGLTPAPGAINGYFLGDDGAYHAVSGGSTPGLQAVLTVSNHANTKIIDSAAIHSDSIITRNAVAHGNVTIGDTTYSTPIIAIANGSSITAGNYGTPWYAQVLSGNFHWALTNQSQVGTSVAPPLANSMYSRISATPYVTSSAYWFGDFGVNDTLTNLTTYQNYVVAIIDSLIVHGFIASHIIINSPPFSPGRLSDSIYVTPDSLAAALRGCVFVNILRPMKTAYYAGWTSLIFSDSLHPWTQGHNYIAQLDIHALYGIQRTANVTINGSSKQQDDTTTRNSTIGGTLNPIGGLVNRADNTTIPITAAKALAFGNYSGLTFHADVTTPDTGSNFHFRYVAQATRSNFDIVDSKAGVEDTVMHIVGANTNNDAIVFHGSTINTGYRYNFNGSAYTAGSIKVTGGYSFGGDNSINSIKLPLFSGSGNVYGFGNDGSNNMLFGNVFGQFQFGGYAGGTTNFTGHSAFSANGTKLFVGTMTDNGNGDVLQVSGTLAATALNIVGDATYRAKAYPLFWNGSNFIGIGSASGTNEVQNSNAFGPWSWGTGFGGSFVAKSQFNTSATRLSINTVDDAINALNVNGRAKITDTFKLPNIVRKLLDSTALKLMAVDASGNVWKTDWPVFGTGKAANDSVAGSGYTTNAHLYKTIDSTKAAYGAPAWGTYTPTFTNTTNIASSSVTGGGYTKLGNCVHVFIAGTLSTTLGANTVTTLTISLPGSYSPAASAIDAGHGVIDLQGAILPNISGVVATTGSSTVTFQFQSSSVITSAPFQLSFDYFY